MESVVAVAIPGFCVAETVPKLRSGMPLDAP